MPWYDLICGKCGHTVDDVDCPMDQRNAQVCEVCRETMHVRPPAVRAVGAIFDKKITYGDQTFETNAQARAWQKENPGFHAVSTASSDYVKMRDRLRNRAEKCAKKQGHRDLDDKRSKQRASKQAKGA